MGEEGSSCTSERTFTIIQVRNDSGGLAAEACQIPHEIRLQSKYNLGFFLLDKGLLLCLQLTDEMQNSLLNSIFRKPVSLLQDVCVHAKSLRSCSTLCDPMDCSLPGSSVHGDSPGKNTGLGCHALLQGSFPTQKSNLHL